MYGNNRTLYSLLKKDKKWLWTKDCQKALEKLIICLISYPILMQPNFNKPFALHTDACGLTVGAILTETDENLKSGGVLLKTLKGCLITLRNYRKRVPRGNLGYKKIPYLFVSI